MTDMSKKVYHYIIFISISECLKETQEFSLIASTIKIMCCIFPHLEFIPWQLKVKFQTCFQNDQSMKWNPVFLMSAMIQLTAKSTESNDRIDVS